ncbi:MAG: D-glucuronyl C5-epimerase family protein [Candidatus Hadarchaeum sp.]|uniref:D-glucuronyl C5-epimerase family protein n=1 Tax=Candidatus Hadarchaeum sp. TaxID=2883567 RepID=UPI003171D0E1
MERVWDSISRLDRWLEQNGWAGYDPYDIKGTPLFLYMQRLSPQAPLFLRGIRGALFALEERYPLLMRKLFGVKKQINAKAMGLFAKAYLNLYEVTGEKRFKDKATKCLDWLVENPSAGYSGLCWEYPFHWQSKVFIPKGTPSAVVSCVVGDGFWKAYQVLGDKKYLDICESICRFLANDLNIDEIDGEYICFSYTPIDDFHVHNANLFAAEFLTRIGQELNQSHYVELGYRAARYALHEQNPDGSLYYWGGVQNHYSPNHIDHYHSGFEIRMLYGMWKLTGDSRYREATERYFRFYLDNLVIKTDGKIIPKMTPKSLYPIDIHSCAEAILCNATLADEFEEARLLLRGLCDWVVTNMQTEDGWFIYMIRKERNRERLVEIPYLRWGQAWMLLALSTCFSVLRIDS